MEILNEVKTNEMQVKVHNVKKAFYCKITETSSEALPFHYDAEYISKLETIRCQTYEEAFTNLTKYLGNLEEPLKVNDNYF